MFSGTYGIYIIITIIFGGLGPYLAGAAVAASQVIETLFN
ncbi:MAG: hypothetical protein ACI81P_000894 [Neolewinella sp.]|jgi:hypothetical protein